MSKAFSYLKRSLENKKIRCIGMITIAAFSIAIADGQAAIKDMNQEQTEVETVSVENGYVAIVNGEEVAVAAESESLEAAFIQAKETMSLTLSFAEPELEIVEKSVASTDLEIGQDILTEKMEQAILSTSDCEGYNYSIVVGEVSFDVSCLAEIEEVFDAVLAEKSNYDAKTVCLDVNDGVSSIYIVAASKYNQVKAAGVVTKADMTITAEDSESMLSFVPAVTVTKVPESNTTPITTEAAVEILMTEDSQSDVYTVAKGDCLSNIADKFDMTLGELLERNPDITSKSIISIGQKLNVKTEQNILRLKTVKIYTAEEMIAYKTEYQENNEWLETKSQTLRVGETGTKLCKYEEILLDGKSSEKHLLQEEITKEPVNALVEIGTQEVKSYTYPVNAVITSYFGSRWGSTHKGIDFGVSIGTEIKAARAGKVIRADWYSSFGKCVEIQHSDGSVTRYAHLNGFEVSYGDEVKQGEVIAYSGNTGRSTGPHLHFEILIGGVQVDPMKYLSK